MALDKHISNEAEPAADSSAGDPTKRGPSVVPIARAREARPRDEKSSPDSRPNSLPPAKTSPPAQDDQQGSKPRKGVLGRHPLLAGAGFVLLVVAVGAGYIYWDYASRFETTDDAFVAARQFAIAPEVAGYITAVPVTDNQHVDAGGLIARIDQRDYKIALEQADARLADAVAGIERIDAQLSVQQAQIAADKARLEQLQAAKDFAAQEASRYEDLARVHAGSVEQAQQYASQLVQQTAAVDSAQANLTLSQRQVESLKAQRASAIATRDEAKAERDKALLNLSYTTVTANQAGRVVQLSAAVGEFAQPGTALTMFVPDEVWIDANFKETQLDAMRPGQPVTIHIDAYPERLLHGHVASVQPGSGTAFSLLPAENATGNYVKIVQRVPVKVILDNPPTDVSIGPGMSVEPSVRIDPTPSLYERVVSRL